MDKRPVRYTMKELEALGLPAVHFTAGTTIKTGPYGMTVYWSGKELVLTGDACHFEAGHDDAI